MIVDEFVRKMKNEDFDILVCAGDLVDMFFRNPNKTLLETAEEIMKKLSSLNRPILCVPGNHDPLVLEDLFDRYKANLHAQLVNISGYSFLGFGGASTPFNTYFEPTDQAIYQSLEKNIKKAVNIILVVHNPPYNTKLDRLLSGEHVGSVSIRKFIEEHQPLLCISAHVHESRGTDKIGRTVLFYPGPLFEKRYGIVKIEGNNAVQCSEKKLD